MWARNIRLTLFFGQLISLGIAGYMEFLIAGYYNLNNKIDSTSGGDIGLVIAYFVVFLTCIFMPLSLVFLLFQRRRDLHRYRIFNILGELYSGFKTDTKFNLLYYLLFGVRRVFYVYLVFNWEDSSWAQIMVLEYMNLFTIIYFGLLKPMSTFHKNRIELFNEFCIQIITLHMICYSDFVPGRFERDVMGWSMIFFITINALYNMSSIFRL